MSVGFRKMAAYVARLNRDTTVNYVSYKNYRSLSTIVAGRYGECSQVPEDCIREIADELAQADLVGFSSMTGYAPMTADIIRHIREVDASTYIVWGGVHPIIVPGEAIRHADAICTGEGEFAFEEFFTSFREGRDYTRTRNFWFRQGEQVIRNGFRPLMTSQEMDELPLLHYGRDERIYRPHQGFVELTRDDYLEFNGLGYNTVWAIGCPFHCTYCGNTRFIENDRTYSKLRHPSVRTILDEIGQALEAHPFLSTVVFHDDSFLALPLPVLEEFAVEFGRRFDLAFCVTGVIPNYVKDRKIQVLLSGGMNRMRMGIQSGSQRILDFYQRPTPVARIEEAASILSRYRAHMIPPAYDIIVDNPVETQDDVCETLAFLYRLARPFTLNIYSLRSIPNTVLEKQMKERNLEVDEISTNYTHIAPTLANCLVYLIASFRVPLAVYRFFVARALPLTAPQPHYPRLALVCRLLYLFRRAFDHLRFMDFSVVTGKTGYYLWKSGFTRFWRRHFVKRFVLPPDPRVSHSADEPAES